MTQPPDRIRIAILFGGRSAEHDVSLLSAANVVNALDPAKYEIVPVFITRDGRWLLAEFINGTLTTPVTGTELALVPGGRGRMIAMPEDGAAHALPPIDILFPVLHGLHGEDGAVQGLAEVAQVALAGCSILGSATALDKSVAKRLLQADDIPVARARILDRALAIPFAEIEATLGLPVFVKPARQGSSVGVSKVRNEADYARALEEGFLHDDRLLAEEFIAGREIEFAVLEDPGGELIVSRPGEIAPAEAHGFYSYEAKYIDENGAMLKVPAALPGPLEAEMKAMAVRAFRALGCDAMARVDFFLMENGRFLVNELNTIPGFTDISMYAKAMAASGIAYPTLIDRLVAHGLNRAKRTE
ncbi:D-alanine--D-alanine ligase [Martelella alba]|uniref:D-alanine--D-alanine ligase n=1 Tax=Martelella alba TaxID=2590451 RepID=A0A506U7F4_9HYPH|nr:D-alanine--D-alanine ligase family protein [Martelella alba]TPW27827.1 D-alanine--D-alanine ligase [Martelella alba]